MRSGHDHSAHASQSTGFFAALLLSIFLGAFLLSSLSIPVALLVAVGFCVFVLSFVSTRFAIYLLIFSMLLSPEFGAMQGEVAEGRNIVVRLDDLLLVVISLSWLARLALLKEGVALFRRTPIGKPIAWYVSIVVIATILGIMMGRIDPLPGFFYTLKYVQYIIVFYMMVNHLDTRKQAKNIVLAAFITCAIICLYAITQIPTGNRVSAPFEGQGGEPNTLGGYLVLMLSMVGGLLLCLKDHRKKLMTAGLGVLMFVPFLYTMSRSSWIALVPMSLVFLVFSRKKIWLVSCLLVAMVAVPAFMPEPVVDRAASTFEEVEWQGKTERIAGIAFDPSASERITRYRESLGRFIKHPVLGYGVTGGGFIDGQFLRTLEETGLAGLLTLLWLLSCIFRTARSNYRSLDDPAMRGLSLGLMAGVAALMGHAVGSSTFIIVRIMEPFWLMVAIVMVAPELAGEETRKHELGSEALLKARLSAERPVDGKVIV